MSFIKKCIPLTLVLLLGLAACDRSDGSPEVANDPPANDSANSVNLTPAHTFNLLDLYKSAADSNNYFPLAIGAAWKIKSRPLREITDIDTINGKVYYLMESDSGPFSDSIYYHITKEGDVYDSLPRFPSGLLFNMQAAVGETYTWTGDWQVTLESKTDTVRLGHYSITDCYRFYIDHLPTADDEYRVYLAPGLGFVQEDYVMTGSFPLEYFILNGQRFDFN